MRTGYAGGPLKLLLATLLVPTTLTACASLSGAPDRVVGVGSSLNLAQRYPIDAALRAFHDSSDSAPDENLDGRPDEPLDLRRGLSPQQYRDMVVSVYLNAIDARYFEFRTALSNERRELGTGFDFAILGLTTAASVARNSIVNSLSAAASVMTGTRASIDRNFYFNETLPALFAAMEARRLRILTRITRNLNRPAEEYPLETAFTDLNAYEMAASLDGAIEEVTAQASEERREAQQRYANAVQACDGEEDVTDATAKIMGFVVRLQGTATAESLESLQSIARLMDLPDDGDAAALRTTIRDALIRNYCTVSGLEDLTGRIRAQPWGRGIDG